jgi:hypothetical protein
MALVGLTSGELHYMRHDGVIVDATDQPLGVPPVDVTLGVWASCAIPGVFRPIRIHGELYVDGGVRDNVPVNMAMKYLGAKKPYVIVSSPVGPTAITEETRDIVSVLMRCLSILYDEANQDEVAFARHFGATVISPRIAVHGPMEVDSQLSKINRDYGWMRAAEVVGGVESEVSDQIASARVALHQAQDPSAIRIARTQLSTAIQSADPNTLPESHQSWATQV